TRIDPGSDKSSTIDLIIASTQFALNSNITLGPYSGSDHLPIITTLNAHPTRLINNPSSWIFEKSKRPQWNSELYCFLTAKSFRNLHHTTGSPPPTTPKELRGPWWNNECQAAEAAAKRAEKVWSQSPFSSDKRSAWKKSEVSLDYFATTPILPPADIEDKSRLDPTIQSYILNKSPHAMNSPFPLNELERALKKTKNKVTGPDLIHNEMLANFSPKNKSNVLRLFNILSISTFVPDAGNQL
ncbi:Uncharacterized protein APZ42_025983, partial [Daphnia magna]